MSFDIDTIIQNHLKNQEVVTESTTTADADAVVAESTKIDFSGAVSSMIESNASAGDTTIETNSDSFLSESELSRIRGAIVASAVVASVEI